MKMAYQVWNLSILSKRLLVFVLLAVTVLQVTAHEDPVLRYVTHRTNASGSKPPLIIMLHGYGGNADEMMRLAQAFPASFNIISAYAPNKISNDGYSWFSIDRTGGNLTI